MKGGAEEAVGMQLDWPRQRKSQAASLKLEGGQCGSIEEAKPWLVRGVEHWSFVGLTFDEGLKRLLAERLPDTAPSYRDL